MAQALLTVSGTIAPDTEAQIDAGRRPRADYLELARALDADLLDVAAARTLAGVFGRVLERVGGPYLLLAWVCFLQRARYGAVFTDGEQVGLPYALLCKYLGFGRRSPRHLMIVHILSVRKKMLFLDYLGVQSHIDRFLVYSTWQQRFIRGRWKLSAERVRFTPFMVDTRFFSPEAVTPQGAERPLICSVGLEARDYTTLLEAVRGVPVDVTIAAASPWSRRADTTEGTAVPENVTVRRYSQYDLRQLYADSRFVVMPLQHVAFQAGVTAILEAMAMGKAIICTRTPGQTDVIVEGETGLYVPPGDAHALRAAIEWLVANPEEAERMGRAGRRRAEQMMSLDLYVARLGGMVRETLVGEQALEQV